MTGRYCSRRSCAPRRIPGCTSGDSPPRAGSLALALGRPRSRPPPPAAGSSEPRRSASPALARSRPGAARRRSPDDVECACPPSFLVWRRLRPYCFDAVARPCRSGSSSSAAFWPIPVRRSHCLRLRLSSSAQSLPPGGLGSVHTGPCAAGNSAISPVVAPNQRASYVPGSSRIVTAPHTCLYS